MPELKRDRCRSQSNSDQVPAYTVKTSSQIVDFRTSHSVASSSRYLCRVCQLSRCLGGFVPEVVLRTVSNTFWGTTKIRRIREYVELHSVLEQRAFEKLQEAVTLPH